MGRAPWGCGTLARPPVLPRLPRRATWLAGAGWPVPAYAHSPIDGLSGFYNGMLHPAVVPAHLAALLGLGLLLGRQPRAVGRVAVIAFMAAITGGLTAQVVGPALALELPLLLTATLVGALVAADRRLPVLVAGTLAIAIGLGIGLDSVPPAADALSITLALAGNALGAVLLLAAGLWLAEALAPDTHRAQAGWRPVAVRVVGAWIAASGFMVASLAIGGPRPADPAQTAIAVGSAGHAVPALPVMATPSSPPAGAGAPALR